MEGHAKDDAKNISTSQNEENEEGGVNYPQKKRKTQKVPATIHPTGEEKTLPFPSFPPSDAHTTDLN